MAPASPKLSAFTLFPLLPTEIRALFWNYALPQNVNVPALCFYDKCQLSMRSLPPSEPGYDFRASHNLHFNLYHSQRKSIHFPLLLFDVCYEARTITLRWLRTQDFTLTVRQFPKRPLSCTRPFGSTCDAFYIPLKSWKACFRRPYNLGSTVHNDFLTPSCDLKKLAIPAGLIGSDRKTLAQIISKYFFKIEYLFAVLEPQPGVLVEESKEEKNGKEEDGWWGFKRVDEIWLMWREDEKKFRLGGIIRDGKEQKRNNEILMALREWTKAEFAKGLMDSRVGHFEIVPVVVVWQTVGWMA